MLNILAKSCVLKLIGKVYCTIFHYSKFQTIKLNLEKSLHYTQYACYNYCIRKFSLCLKKVRHFGVPTPRDTSIRGNDT